MKQNYHLVIVVLSILSYLTFAKSIIWELEDYNDWNLPFAKTVEIRSKQDAAETQSIPPKSYKMRIDPSVLFSIIFLQPE